VVTGTPAAEQEIVLGMKVAGRLAGRRSVSQINRLDRQVTLQASVAPGYGLADRSQALV